MDTEHLPGGYPVPKPGDIISNDDYRRMEIPKRQPVPRLRRRPVRPYGLGYQLPRHRTGTPEWFAEMKRNAAGR